MKVVMLETMAGPEGVARPNTVLDVTNDQSKELLEGKYARKYDHEEDRDKPRGRERYRRDPDA